MTEKRKKQYAPIHTPLDDLYKDFFNCYDCDHFLKKLELLDRCYGLEDDEKTKKMIVKEIHFLFFHLTETLFNFIFLLRKYKEREIWMALSFCDHKKSSYYTNISKMINELDEESEIFQDGNVSNCHKKQKENMNYLQYLFYLRFKSNLNLTDKQEKENIKNIKTLLLIFAKEFKKRKAEYNAYKHGLRFYNSSFSLGIGVNENKPDVWLGHSDNAITFLESKETEDKNVESIYKTTFPFDFDTDKNMCLAIIHLINNIIETRKCRIKNEYKPKMIYFHNIDLKDYDHARRVGVQSSSFSV